MNTDQQSFEKAFYSDGYKLGMMAVEAGMTKKALFSAIEKMHEGIDGLIESLFEFAKQQNKRIECKKGCEWCCHQPVFALDYELDYLNDFINEFLEAEVKSEVLENAQAKKDKLSRLQKDDLLDAKFPCPLLKAGSCQAYYARPMACRIYLSSNVLSCYRFFQTPNDKNNYPALLDFPMRAGRMMNEGFKAALKTIGIVAKEYRIEEKLM